MSFTFPFDAPVAFASLSTGRPVARSIFDAQFTCTYGSARITSPVARSIVYAKPFLSKCTSALRTFPFTVRSTSTISAAASKSQLSCGVNW